MFFFLFPSCVGSWAEQACVYVCSTCVNALVWAGTHARVYSCLRKPVLDSCRPPPLLPHLIDRGRIAQSNLDLTDTARELPWGILPLLCSPEFMGRLPHTPAFTGRHSGESELLFDLSASTSTPEPSPQSTVFHFQLLQQSRWENTRREHTLFTGTLK